MSESSLLAFVITATIIEMTPGPNMGYLAVLAVTAGRRAALVATAGTAAGLMTVGVAASIGLANLLTASNATYQSVRWAGVIYLLWLAWKGWHNSTNDVSSVTGPRSQNRFFVQGLTTNLLNPKATIFYIAILPAFIDSERPLLPQTAILLIVYVTIASGIHSIVVILASSMTPMLKSGYKATLIRRVLSVSLALMAGWLLYTTRRFSA